MLRPHRLYVIIVSDDCNYVYGLFTCPDDAMKYALRADIGPGAWEVQEVEQV